jgi:exopolysaccharide biosynthesis protein
MYILDVCEDGDILNAFRIGKEILKIIRIVVPMLIVIISIKDVFQYTVANSGEGLSKIITPIFKRLIAGLIVFLIPSWVDVGFELASTEAKNYHACIDNATPEGIKNAYYNKAKKLIAKAKDTLEPADLKTASAYLRKVEDESKRKELQNQINEIQEYVNISQNILGMTKLKHYKALKELISKVKDAAVKTKLTDKLEEKFKTLDLHDVAKVKVEGVDLVGANTVKEETESLKIYVNKVGSHYVSQIWVENPYTQLNKYDSPNYGSGLYRPGDLLQRAIAERGLNNKLIIGFNASGFYLRDTYDAASVNYYPKYDRTSVGTLVITDGKVVRNAYDKAYKTWFIAGVDGRGYLKIFKDEKTSDVNAKKAWADSVIGTVRNTFTFASPLVYNGQASNDTTSMPSPGSSLNRQAICQIDRNNFLLITGAGLNRNDMINIMLQAKCQTGTNFDGGGSIALLYKSKNSNQVQTIIGNGRSLTEVGYFAE